MVASQRFGKVAYLVLFDLERHIITELVNAYERIVEGANAFLAQGEAHKRHGDPMS